MHVTGIMYFGSLSGYTSFPEDITCPLDSYKFEIYVTGSYTTFNTLRDFEKRGAVGELYQNYVHSCPKCHFSGYQSDFDTSFHDTTKAHLLELLKPYKTIFMDAVTEHMIAISIYKYFRKDNDDIANLYLVASYFLRYDELRIEERKELQRNCASYLIKAVENHEYPKKETNAVINYLIGDLYRRTGNFETAILHYDLSLNDKNGADWIKKWAKEQKELAIARNESNTV
jgi:uncharacterized protein (DUF2225 family)